MSGKKKPDVPRRSPSAFALYRAEVEEEMKKKYPYSGSRRIFLISKNYRELSDTEKKKYIEMAEQLYIHYGKQLEEYEKQWGPIPKKDYPSTTTSKEGTPGTRSRTGHTTTDSTKDPGTTSKTDASTTLSPEEDKEGEEELENAMERNHSSPSKKVPVDVVVQAPISEKKNSCSSICEIKKSKDEKSRSDEHQMNRSVISEDQPTTTTRKEIFVPEEIQGGKRRKNTQRRKEKKTKKH